MEYLISAILLIAFVKKLIHSENVDYDKYLKSNHWKHTRRKALKRYGNKCALCGSTKNLQIHHNSYKNLWHEKPTDLICLCSRCHAKHHNKKA